VPPSIYGGTLRREGNQQKSLFSIVVIDRQEDGQEVSLIAEDVAGKLRTRAVDNGVARAGHLPSARNKKPRLLSGVGVFSELSVSDRQHQAMPVITSARHHGSSPVVGRSSVADHNSEGRTPLAAGPHRPVGHTQAVVAARNKRGQALHTPEPVPHK